MARIRKARKRNRKIESDVVRPVHPVVIVVTRVNRVVVPILIAVNQHQVQVRVGITSAPKFTYSCVLTEICFSSFGIHLFIRKLSIFYKPKNFNIFSRL